MALSDQAPQQALTRYGIAEIEAGKLDLLRMARRLQLVEEPVVQWAMVFEFQRADGMRDVLNGIGHAVRKVVHRVDTPSVAGAVMRGVQNAKHHRIAHV